MNTKAKKRTKKDKRIRRLECELNKVAAYYWATVTEDKLQDKAPDGFRETPRKVCEQAQAVLRNE